MTEYNNRKVNFQKAAREIEKLRSNKGNAKFEHNFTSDLTPEEYSKLLGLDPAVDDLKIASLKLDTPLL